MRVAATSVKRNRSGKAKSEVNWSYLELKKAVERVDRWNAAKLETQQCRAIVFCTVAWCLSNENKIGSERSYRLWKVQISVKFQCFIWFINHLWSGSITHNRDCRASIAAGNNRNLTEVCLFDTNIVIAWKIGEKMSNDYEITKTLNKLFVLPCKRFPRKYFDQSVFWSSITSNVKHRSLLNACTLETVDAAADTKFAPWSRAAPVKLCTRCNKLSRDFAGLDGAEVPKVDYQISLFGHGTFNLHSTSCWPFSKTQR